MKQVLVDTGPLVALCDERDPLHPRALRELSAIKAPLSVSLPVLTEALFLLGDGRLRARLGALFERGAVSLDGPDDPETLLARCWKWLARFAEHRPDFTDAFLVNWAAGDSALAVWTFDREFRDVWRSPSGKRIRLAVR